jgi:hypothetical protein
VQSRPPIAKAPKTRVRSDPCRADPGDQVDRAHNRLAKFIVPPKRACTAQDVATARRLHPRFPRLSTGL